MDWLRLFIIAAIVLIIGSLASALVFLMKDKGATNRTVRALTVRVGLSVALFLFLIAGLHFGFIKPTRPL